MAILREDNREMSLGDGETVQALHAGLEEEVITR